LTSCVCRLGDGFGIDPVVLAVLDEGLDVLWRPQPHPMPQLAQLAAPVVRAVASFQSNLGRRQLAEEWFHLAAAQFPPQRRLPVGIHPVQGEHMLGRINGEQCKFHHGPPLVGVLTTQLWHSMPWGRPHQHAFHA
jgi:hypothetical protein